MASSHVLKMTPSDESSYRFRRLPSTYLCYRLTRDSPLKKRSFTVDRNTNLPDRCEALAQSVIDLLKTQQCEAKGSPVALTGNQVALVMFMLSHYIADGHMPFHCDSRRFSEGSDLHRHIEELWDEQVRRFFQIDFLNERFYYDQFGYPLLDMEKRDEYASSFLGQVEEELARRRFVISYGPRNSNLWDFMTSLCQYSYLMSYELVGEGFDESGLTSSDWRGLGALSFEDVSVAVFIDAIDSIARAWFHVWRGYLRWRRRRG